MDNEAAMRHFYEEINAGDVDAATERLADGFVEHEAMPGLEPNKEGTRQLFGMMIAAFPDLRFDAEDILTSDEKVVARSRVTGTNKGQFMGMPATGKSINAQAIDIVRFGNDGLVVEHWGVMDMMSIMQQLGAVPQGPPA
jgi:steroid delta-isomerase-like uncharacterized protein